MDSQTIQTIKNALVQLKSPDASLRLKAVQQLDQLDVTHPSLLEQIHSVALRDPDPNVRAAAGQILNRQNANQTSSEVNPLPADHLTGRVTNLSSAPIAANPGSDEKILALLSEQNQLLADIKKHLVDSTLHVTESKDFLQTEVIDINMSIGNIIEFMFKWLVASIPVGIVVAVVYFLLIALFLRPTY